MQLDKKFFEDMIIASKRDQEFAKASYAKNDGVIAFCEICIKMCEENENNKSLPEEQPIVK